MTTDGDDNDNDKLRRSRIDYNSTCALGLKLRFIAAEWKERYHLVPLDMHNAAPRKENDEMKERCHLVLPTV